LQNRLKPLIRKSQPYKKRIADKGIWVEPTVLAEIEYRAKVCGREVAASILQGIARRLGVTNRVVEARVSPLQAPTICALAVLSGCFLPDS
jgi:hypothetical protein